MTTENDSSDDEFFEMSRVKKKDIQTPVRLLSESTPDIGDRVSLWKDEIEQIGNKNFELA